MGLFYPPFTRKCEIRCVLELTLLVMERKFMVVFVKSDLYIKLPFYTLKHPRKSLVYNLKWKYNPLHKLNKVIIISTDKE